MDNDDLPPRQEDHSESTLAFSLGQVAGAFAWVGLAFGVVGVLLYAAVKLNS